MSQSQITKFFQPKNGGNVVKKSTTNSPLKRLQDNEEKKIKTDSSNDSPPKKRCIKANDEETKISPKDKQKESSVNDPIENGSNISKEDKASLSPTAKLNKNSSSPNAKALTQNKNEKLCDLSKPVSAGETYDPAKSDYHPINDAVWKKNEKTPYIALARTFQLIEETRGRLQMIDVLSNFFWSVIVLSPDDLLPSVYLTINQLAPAYEGMELGVAEHTLMKVICRTTGRKLDQIKAQTTLTGDLGIVAEQSRVAQKVLFHPKALTICGVFQKLHNVSKISGKTKIDLIQELFIACRHSEARFLMRSLLGKIRIGLAEQSMLQSLTIAFLKYQWKSYDELLKVTKTKNFSNDETFKKNLNDMVLILRTAHSHCPNYNKIIPALLKYGIQQVNEHCSMETGVPIKPMLAHPTKGIREVLERFNDVEITCEWKYDGERAQIHCSEDGVVKIYSRNQENNTDKYPDVISRIGQFKKGDAKSFIIDSEIVAWDVENKSILPFQVLTTRKRKNVDLNEIKVQVCVYAFDLLYFNGEELVTQPFIERRRLLKENFQEVEGIWQFATANDTNNIEEVQRFLGESIKGNCEGLMIKTLHTNATYEIAKRSRNWLKLKKDYLDSVGDSLDLVVIGGYNGKGKRTGTYGGYLLACYDNENEVYQSICKIGTGFSDEDLREHSASLKQHIIETPKSYYWFDSNLNPDVWFEPVQVWEVKCADLSLSPVHRAAIGLIDPEKGISLRFPRFIRIRSDKSAEEATSMKQVAHMYSSQDQIKNQATATTEMDDFY